MRHYGIAIEGFNEGDDRASWGVRVRRPTGERWLRDYRERNRVDYERARKMYHRVTVRRIPL